jgi:5S rRNA maturation endonuclease (ribonuclease M5)
MDEIHYIEGHENREKKIPDPWEGWTKEDEKYINPLPYEVLREFDILQFGHDKFADACRKWLNNERLIPTYIANMFKLRYDEINRALIFSLTGTSGEVYLLRSRSIREKKIWTVSPKIAGYPNLIFPKLRDVGAWFGMEFIDWSKPVMTVEAELDVMRLAALGVYNVIASATSSVSKAQVEALTGAQVLILGYDADKAGRDAHRRIIKGIKGRTQGISILEIDWSVARKHPKFRKDKKDLKCKDPGDLQGKSGVSKVFRNMTKKA